MQQTCKLIYYEMWLCTVVPYNQLLLLREKEHESNAGKKGKDLIFLHDDLCEIGNIGL